MGIVSVRVYLLISVLTAGALYLVTLLDRSKVIAGFIRSQGASAAGSGLGSSVAGFVAEPLANVFSDPTWAIIGGFLWPLVLLWLLFLVAIMIFAYAGAGFGITREAITFD